MIYQRLIRMAARVVHGSKSDAAYSGTHIDRISTPVSTLEFDRTSLWEPGLCRLHVPLNRQLTAELYYYYFLF
jgi:hypothetical protein